MWKYTDDTVIMGCMVNGNEGEYISLWQDFAKYCRSNKLQLNTFKSTWVCSWMLDWSG